MDKLISPVGEDWSADREAVSAISTWERDTGLRLPDDYRGFMLRYDGGRPYPLMFRHTALEAEGFENPTEHYLDPLYSWRRVASWNRELGNRLPPGCMSIGADPGLLEIALSLRDEDHGAIYSWVRNWGAWGSEDNSYLCLQAPSFRAFTTSLFDHDDRSGYDYWHTPRREQLKRTLDI
ncbi:SMI1/KNR4 family protein [Bosea vestrisii]|uniref:SMI1/KNR4 family protein n=1 Tax=Bosea vestrisii TaxID=151416 RepID=UPI0024E033C9|nr:SMI1/KNR4 family protein [Bosea vestrisii]WID95362.1 SMI1/KNR4 family protein [Bosea vestrisii]